MRRQLTEFLGTSLLVLTVVACVLSGSALTPIAVGAVLAALVYAGGHVSGGHYNPAVTVAAWLRGALPGRDVAGYVVAQVAGGAAGGLLGRSVVGTGPASVLDVASGRTAAAAAAELVVTFALAWVVLHVATSADHPGNSFYGLAIGATVLAGAAALGGVSGGAFNPAVALGAAGAGLVSWGSLWVYVIADVAGGALAALAFRYVEPAQRTAEPSLPPATARPTPSGAADVPAPRTPSDAPHPATP